MVTETALLRWIVALPALGVLFHAFLGRRMPAAVKVVGPGLVLGGFALALHSAVTLRGLGPEAALRDHVYTWIAAGGFAADVAFRLDALSAVIREVGGELLEEATVFDVYTGKPIPEGRKNVAYALRYRSKDRTLTDTEVNEAHAKIVEELNRRLKGSLRGA